MSCGKVKWFNDQKGFGFLADPLIDGDIFVHYTVIEGRGRRTLAEGEEVEYDLASDDKGARASRVVRLAPPPPGQKPPPKAKKMNGRPCFHKRKLRPPAHST
jgi:cold shock protein